MGGPDGGGFGADSVSFSALTDGAGVGAVSPADGIEAGPAGSGREVTMICSPFVMGMEARTPSESGKGFGGYPYLTDDQHVPSALTQA